MKNFLIVLMLVIFSASISNAQGYDIEVKINHIPNDTLILGHHFNEKLIPDDTIVLDSRCKGRFVGKEKLPQGMYFIFLPNRTYFDILLDNNQKFYIENDTTDFLKNMVVERSIENQIFRDYQLMLGQASADYSKLSEEFKKANGDKKKEEEVQGKMKLVSQRVEEAYYNQIEKYPNQFFSTFLTATRDVQVPESITDNTDRYYYYKQHFFDNFPLEDPRLLRTVLYQPKVEKYIENMCMQMPDSLIKECNMLINRTRGNDELFRFMLVYLFNKYAKSLTENMYSENVYVSLAKIYCKEAKWDTDSFKTQLAKKIEKKSNCLVGNKSIDLLMKQLPGDSIAISRLRPALDLMRDEGVAAESKHSDFEDRRNDVVKILDKFINKFGGYHSVHSIPAKYKLIAFWEPDCSHCKEEMPKLFNFYRDTLRAMDCKVFAIYMNKSVDNFKDLHRHVGKWFDFVIKQKFFLPGWYNFFNPFDQYRDHYDVNSTPTFYLLDENNEIIGKRISYHQMYELMKFIDEHNEKK